MTRIRAVALATLFAVVFSCSGEDGEQCFDDRSCGTGRRCDRLVKDEPGECVLCDGTETQYDGIDNDCNAGTRDVDLDGDGDNAVTSPVVPGGDCDDNDPTVSPRLRETCADSKDNDCDGRVDEPDCADFAPPTMAFTRPSEDDVLSGLVTVELDVTDDAGVVSVQLFAGVPLVGKVTTAPYSFSLDTEQLTDGPLILRAVATDIAGRTTELSLAVVVDNMTPPEITLLGPMEGAHHGGSMVIDVMVEDGTGVQDVQIAVGAATVTLTMAPYLAIVDTTTIADGRSSVTVIARDTLGNQSSTTRTFYVDNTPPVLTFNNPMDGDLLSGAINVSLTSTDTGAGVRRMEALSASSNGPLLTFSLNTRTIPNGTFVITATVSDSAIINDTTVSGNTVTASITTTVYNTPLEPTVLILDPVDGDGVYRRTLIQTNVLAPLGVDRVEFFVRGDPIGTDSDPPYEFEYDFSGQSGTASVSAVVYDLTAVTATDTVTVSVVPMPTFRLAKSIPLPEGVAIGAVEIADVTGDGVVDLVAAQPALTVITGTTTSVPGIDFPFSAGSAIPIAVERPIELRLIDLNGDSARDIVALYPTEIRRYTNDTTGAFSLTGTFPLGGSRVASTFDLADLDGDLDVDVVVGTSATGTGDIFVYLQDQNQFNYSATRGLVGEVTDIVLADVDGDADTDVAVGRVRTDFVTIYQNGGAANFGVGQDSFSGGPPQKVAVADVTGDTYPDVIAMLPGEVPAARTAIMAGDPASPAQFALIETLYHTGSPNGFVLGDIDGDLDLDLVVSIPDSNGLDVRMNDPGAATPDFPFSEGARRDAYAMGRGVRDPKILDLNGDGDPDLVMLDSLAGTMAVAPNRGAAGGRFRFGAAPMIPIDPIVVTSTCPFGRASATRVPNAVSIGDLVAGGLPDLVFGVNSVDCLEDPVTAAVPPPIPPAIVVVQNAGSGVFTSLPQIDLPEELSPTEIAIGDLDGLGDLDLAVGSPATFDVTDPTPTAALLLSVGVGTYDVNLLSIQYPISAAIGDVDNDGQGEAVFATQDPEGVQHGVEVYEADGTPQYSNLIGLGANSVVIGNLDDDPLGTIDFAVANSGSDNVTVHAWNGSSWTRRVYNTNGSISALIDTQLGPSGDVRTDLVGVGDSGVILLEGDETFVFGSPSAWDAGTPSTPFRIRQGDFNRDGINDVMVLNGASDSLAMLIARPQGGYFAPDLIPISNEPTSMAVGSLYGAQIDVVMVNVIAPSILLLLNETP